MTHKQHAANLLATDTLALMRAEELASDREVRRSLGRLVLRTIEKLEAELLTGRTKPSSTAACAREIRGAAEYLDNLLDKMSKVDTSTNPQDIERKLLQLNELVAALQKLRRPGAVAEGYQDQGPGDGVGVEMAASESAHTPEAVAQQPVSAAQEAGHAGVSVAHSGNGTTEAGGTEVGDVEGKANGSGVGVVTKRGRGRPRKLVRLGEAEASSRVERRSNATVSEPARGVEDCERDPDKNHAAGESGGSEGDASPTV